MIVNIFLSCIDDSEGMIFIRSFDDNFSCEKLKLQQITVDQFCIELAYLKRQSVSSSSSTFMS